MIYFVLSPVVGMVKIGQSKHPRERLDQIQIHSADRLLLLGSIEAQASMEGRIHQYLFDHHSHGEWFHFNKHVKQVVGEMLDDVFDWALLPGKGRKAWALAWDRSDNPLSPNGKPRRFAPTQDAAA